MEKLKAFLQKDIAGIPVWAIAIAIVIGLFIARRMLTEKEAGESEGVDEVTPEESDLLDEGLVDGTGVGFSESPPPNIPPIEVRIDPTAQPIRKPCFYRWGTLFFAGDWDKLWVINRGKPRNQKLSKTVKQKGKNVQVPIGPAEFSRRNPRIAACLKKVPVSEAIKCPPGMIPHKTRAGWVCYKPGPR